MAKRPDCHMHVITWPIGYLRTAWKQLNRILFCRANTIPSAKSQSTSIRSNHIYRGRNHSAHSFPSTRKNELRAISTRLQPMQKVLLIKTLVRTNLPWKEPRALQCVHYLVEFDIDKQTHVQKVKKFLQYRILLMEYSIRRTFCRWRTRHGKIEEAKA